MCGNFCFGFIDFMIEVKSLLDYTYLFYPNKYERNGRIILRYFQQLNIFLCIDSKYC